MKLSDLPEITFVTADAKETENEILTLAESILGRKIERADPVRLLIKVFTAILIQYKLTIDEVAKMNLLAYAKSEYLERLGDLVGVERLPATKAVTTVEVKLSAPRSAATVIRQGTRITPGEGIYFALDEDIVFAAGEEIKQAAASCTVTGEIGNDFAAGEINKIVDPQAFLLSIVNVTKSEGGANIESDDSLRERIHEAPEAYSCAGSAGAYIFHAKSASALIADVGVHSPEPGKVDIYLLMKDGGIPSTEMIQTVEEHLSADTVRPLTDNVSVLPAQVVEYNLDVSFWIDRDDAVCAAEICEAAQVAVNEYVAWQKKKLGRDLNPSELIHRLKKAGVKRVEVRSPQFTITDKFTVAIASSINAVFEGLEDG